MNSTIKEILNKYEIQKHTVENQLMALVLLSYTDSEVRAAIASTPNISQCLRRLKGSKGYEVQYATA